MDTKNNVTNIAEGSKGRPPRMCMRCRRQSWLIVRSAFDHRDICQECKTTERMHPKYIHALKADDAAMMKGDRNFEGIGLPTELAGGAK